MIGKYKKLLIIIGILIAIAGVIFYGYTFQKEVKKSYDQQSESLSKARDVKRSSDVSILNTALMLYSVRYELPTKKDKDGKYQILKLIKDSSDYNLLLSALQKDNLQAKLPTDPKDPERYYEYYSDGKTYIIRTFFENSKNNCKMLKQGYCQYEVQGKSDY